MSEFNINNRNLIPPCQNACPVKTRARDYVAEVAMGRLEEAYAIITENNPFPSVCGRVCMHPCETDCRRNQIDQPISIAALKRYAADYVNENKLCMDRPAVKNSGKKVAIVGGGPSGLAAAVKLAEAGHEVKVIEKNKKAGGMLRYGIPKYRLDDGALDEDIKRIKAKGVKIETSKGVEDSSVLHEFREDSDAVLVSIGLSESRALPIEGMDAKGVHLAIPFLTACSSDNGPKIGKKVLVIGGGNVAIDAARSARRLDPKAKITIACLESADEIPASPLELEEADEEKIDVRNCMGPKRVEINNGKVSGMHFITCASVFDEKGQFSPVFMDHEKHFIEVDTVIVAIGQQSNIDFLPEPFKKNGRIVLDNEILAITDDGLFACGEVARGPGAAISAIANGNEAARIINLYLAEKEIHALEDNDEVIAEVPATISSSRIVKIDRQQTELVEPSVRVKNFKEFDNGLSKRSATKEALRCMDCGSGAFVEAEKCISCLTCVRVCPYWVAKIDPESSIATMPVEGCQACGACAAECPAKAIDLKGYALKDVHRELKEGFKKKKPNTVGFLCQTGKDLGFGAAHIIRVKCPIRLETEALLKPFELGAKKVFVICHKDTSCRYIEGPKYIKRRVGYLKEMLDNIGVGGENIEVFEKSEKENISKFMKTGKEKVKVKK